MFSFIAASYGTVADVEILWTLIAFVGLCFSLHNLTQAIADLKFLRREGITNGRVILASFAIRAEAARATIQTIFIAIGILAMTIPEAPQADLPTKLVVFGAIFRWGLIISTSLIALKSYWGWSVRRQLFQEREIREKADSVQIEADTVTVNGESEPHVERKEKA